MSVFSKTADAVSAEIFKRLKKQWTDSTHAVKCKSEIRSHVGLSQD